MKLGDTVLKGAEVKRGTTINGTIATILATTKVAEGKPAIYHKVTLDFTDCPKTTLIELASKSVMIDIQGRFRKDKKIPGEYKTRVPLVTRKRDSGPALGTKEHTERSLDNLDEATRKSILDKYIHDSK